MFVFLYDAFSRIRPTTQYLYVLFILQLSLGLKIPIDLQYLLYLFNYHGSFCSDYH